MPTLIPGHLLEQADRLLRPRSQRLSKIRQADRRRAISTAYYAVFHATLTALADEFIGSGERKTKRYALAYRSVDHAAIKKLCKEAVKQTVADKYKDFVPENGFGDGFREFASLILLLKEQRNSADYDPSIWITLVNARTVISSARIAIQHLMTADESEKRAFLTLLAFPPRST